MIAFLPFFLSPMAWLAGIRKRLLCISAFSMLPLTWSERVSAPIKKRLLKSAYKRFFKFVVPPSLRNAIMGVERYVSSDFVDGRSVQNGKIGNLYGIDVFTTSNCPLTYTTTVKAAFLVHKDTMVMAEQQGIRSQTQYKQEFLGTLYTADTLYGVKTLRPESGFVLAVAA